MFEIPKDFAVKEVMCGIIGVFDSKGEPVENELPYLRAGMAHMESRGPDGEGVFQEGYVALGHRRLAILDLKKGRQPWRDPKTGGVVSYNGEIYNFKEIRDDLEGLGYEFESDCDTEVLLKAFIHWGPSAVSRFNGIFAFAFYDPREHVLFLVRDRIGVKPLYYSIIDGRCYFSSTMAALLQFEAIERCLDLVGVSHYLATIRTTIASKTLIRNVSTLEPGTMLRLRVGEEDRIDPYWSYPVMSSAEKPDVDFGEACDHVKFLVSDSIKKQLISDVPLGGFLSGGIDSTVIASEASAMTGGHFNAYSVGYDEEGYGEWPYIQVAADAYGMRCEQIHLKPEDYSVDWDFLIANKGLPLSTPNEVGILRLAQALREEFTVALSGEGADEIFGGYVRSYLSAWDYDRSREDNPNLDFLNRLKAFYGQASFSGRREHFFLVNTWVNADQKAALFQGDVWRSLEFDRDLCEYYDGLFQKVSKCTTLDAYLQVHARINLEGLLSRVDSSTMAASVEARVPFTDHRLVELLFSFPDAFKLALAPGNSEDSVRHLLASDMDASGLIESKRLLRSGFANQIPESILNRPKMSFPVPFQEWFQTIMFESIRDALLGNEVFKELMNVAVLEELLEADKSPARGLLLWPLANLSKWMARWNVRI